MRVAPAWASCPVRAVDLGRLVAALQVAATGIERSLRDPEADLEAVE